VSIVIWYNLCLSYNYCSHSLGRSSLQNKIRMSWVNNDYVYQIASIICCKHNNHLSPWWLERWHWENMRFLAQNMQPNIPSNGGKKFSNYIMCGLCVMSHEHNEICVSMLNLWHGCICFQKYHKLCNAKEKIGWGRPNSVCNAKEKMLEAILKDGMIGWVESHTWD
jgi:hypothetical protein